MAVAGEIQIGRINRFFTKWLGAKGSSPRMTIGSELTGVIPLWSGAENRFLDSWNRFAVGASATGGGVSPAALRIRNPGGSNVIAVIEKASLSSSINDVLLLQYFTVGVDLPTPVVSTNARLDARGAANPVCTISDSTAFVHGGVATLAASGLANATYDFLWTDIQEIPLLPGDAITMQVTGVTAVLIGSFMWRERALEDSERS